MPRSPAPLAMRRSPAGLAPRRWLAQAARVGIPVRLGTPNAGSDGSPFVRDGVADARLSWRGRCSYSPAETRDLADVQFLARAIVALVGADAAGRARP